MAGIYLPMMVNARSEAHLLGVPMTKKMVFHRADREIKPKKLTDFDWRAAGFKSSAEFQGYISENISNLKAEVEHSQKVDVIEKA